jgi:ABC-type branched-subunit amino acid transport system substrate-binding protein
MRKAALDRATNISARTVNNEMLQIVADPQVQAVKPARVFLEGIAKDAIDAAKSGDAESLYSVRKYITDLIDKRVDSPDNVAGFASTKLQAMKRVIDNAIENGGAGGSWRAYLNEYATRSQAIDKSVERAAGMYKPAQITSVPGGAAIAESTATHLPNLLSRSAMIANYIARAARNNVEPKLDASMAQDFLNPQMMAEVLKKADPASRSWLQKALATQAKKAVVVLPVQAVSRGLGQ